MYEKQLGDIERRILKREGKCEAYRQAAMVTGSKAVRQLWYGAVGLHLFYQAVKLSLCHGTPGLADFIIAEGGLILHKDSINCDEWISVIAGWISDEEGARWCAEREVL